MVLDFIEDQILTQELHTRLLVILKGNRKVQFQHALCFIRKDFVNNRRSCKQMLMLDCKNTGPCFYPRMYAEQLHFKHDERVNAKKDLEDGVYHSADIYTLSARPVAGEEKRVLENRMKWVLTGEDKYWKDSNAIGNEAAVEKKIEDAEMRIQGKRRIAKRKGKRSNFKQRPDRTKTETRRAHSGPKTETTKTGLEDILIEASNNSGGEAEDTKMIRGR